MSPEPTNWITDGMARWGRIPVTCDRCSDDDNGPWIPIGDGQFLCEACWESRTP